MTNAELVSTLMELPPDAQIVTSLGEVTQTTVSSSPIVGQQQHQSGPLVRYSVKHNVICISPRTVML